MQQYKQAWTKWWWFWRAPAWLSLCRHCWRGCSHPLPLPWPSCVGFEGGTNLQIHKVNCSRVGTWSPWTLPSQQWDSKTELLVRSAKVFDMLLHLGKRCTCLFTNPAVFLTSFKGGGQTHVKKIRFRKGILTLTWHKILLFSLCHLLLKIVLPRHLRHLHLLTHVALESPSKTWQPTSPCSLSRSSP